jgi:trehalose 6-phosphate phosphatase
MTIVSHSRVSPLDLWSQAGLIQHRIAHAARVFLFLDFDGTLAPIAPTPSLAAMPDGLRCVLESLCLRRDVVATVISGRPLDDLIRKVGLPLIYAGNHGLDIRGMGLEYTAPIPAKATQQLRDCCEILRVLLQPFSGAWIEDKQRTIAVHLRQVARFQIPAAEDLVRATVMEYPELRIRGGKEVLEIRPNIAWNKGYAARWILRQMRGSETGAICLGDDSTDEDMFHELPSGITITIGDRSPTESQSSAQYWLAEKDVPRFFSLLQVAIEHLRASGNGSQYQGRLR